MCFRCRLRLAARRATVRLQGAVWGGEAMTVSLATQGRFSKPVLQSTKSSPSTGAAKKRHRQPQHINNYESRVVIAGAR